MNNRKFILKCTKCGKVYTDFKQWFAADRHCTCGSARVEAEYNTDYRILKSIIESADNVNNTMWKYFDFLPLENKENIVSAGEGNIGIDNWKFMEQYAKRRYDIDCKVYAYRSDKNPGTGTFKDTGASLAAGVLKENGVKNYVVASTGNVANAFACYLSKAGISLSAFIPSDALTVNGAGVSYYGQKVFRVNGDYTKAKKTAAEYSLKFNIPMTGGNTDPLRIEAKRTMVFEWLRRLPRFPTVYVQALSGGTGFIAIDKALREIRPLKLIERTPRYIAVQPDGCAPMAEAWQDAVESNFAEGWEKKYPVYENPRTTVPTLATGNPVTYPIIGNLVKDSGGEIISFEEKRLFDIVRAVAYESQVGIGPASAIALGGFFDSLASGSIKNGDAVMINIGEGIDRAPEFFEDLTYTEQEIDDVDDCELFDRNSLREKLWDKIEK